MHQHPIRKECPPGACTCRREQLFEGPGGDMRILLLTREEEKRLVARIEELTTLADLRRIADRMREQLGMVLRIAPGGAEVRTVRGLSITLDEQPGLCRKTRQAIPAAVRRCLERHPEIVYAILNERDLLRDL
ncbi:hypothetical protein [Noviherbaspirillum aridicola]|uniref:Ribosomal protein S3AE n=1 Tax=Noviherbaspirillum aridicola TaxID=2849687 RepID=A0ABQ4Q0D0_9BURK|nr:hypothetical protein [Noviherbaspirillum aridicola]GIZ50224.1 hypothetical protein NCCP691_02380 [Noviherbaspirillum aridicola]